METAQTPTTGILHHGVHRNRADSYMPHIRSNRSALVIMGGKLRCGRCGKPRGSQCDSPCSSFLETDACMHACMQRMLAHVCTSARACVNMPMQAHIFPCGMQISGTSVHACVWHTSTCAYALGLPVLSTTARASVNSSDTEAGHHRG